MTLGLYFQWLRGWYFRLAVRVSTCHRPDMAPKTHLLHPGNSFIMRQRKLGTQEPADLKNPDFVRLWYWWRHKNARMLVVMITTVRAWRNAVAMVVVNDAPFRKCRTTYPLRRLDKLSNTYRNHFLEFRLLNRTLHTHKVADQTLQEANKRHQTAECTINSSHNLSDIKTEILLTCQATSIPISLPLTANNWIPLAVLQIRHRFTAIILQADLLTPHQTQLVCKIKIATILQDLASSQMIH